VNLNARMKPGTIGTEDDLVLLIGMWVVTVEGREHDSLSDARLTGSPQVVVIPATRARVPDSYRWRSGTR
jgi:hypothetical protein